MSNIRQLTLPITGMTCANCVATVERNLKKLEGVQSAVVNLSSERATVDFEPNKLQLADVIARVNRAGYGVATGEAASQGAMPPGILCSQCRSEPRRQPLKTTGATFDN